MDRYKNYTLRNVKEERNILLTIKKGKLSGSTISCVGTTLLEEIIKGKTEVARRRRTRKKLLHDL